MKVAVAVLALALAASSVQCFSLRQLIGTCVEMCSGNEDCPSGTTCRSNGCGHTCQSSSLTSIKMGSRGFSLRQLTVGTCVEACFSDADCGQGLTCRSNGCGHTCQNPLSLIGNLANCRLTAICNSYCFYGHARDANGCPTCGCNPAPVSRK